MNIKNKIIGPITGLKGVMAKVFGKKGLYRKKVAIFAVSGMTMLAITAGVALSFVHQPAYSLSFGHKGFHHHNGIDDIDDDNRDGKLTVEDVEIVAKKRFAHIDRDEDGKLTSADWCHKRKKNDKGKEKDCTKANYKFEAMLKLIDADTNGEVTESEFIDYAAQKFAAVDVDGDGELSEEEADNDREVMRAERQKEMFKVMDSDGNGQISEEEYTAFANKFSRHHGRRGGKRHNKH